MKLHVSALFIYPVKSLAGVPLSQAELTPTGFRFDRSWMIVDQYDVFLTQRQHPRMARVKVVPAADSLKITVPGSPAVEVPVKGDAPVRTVTVWENRCDAVDQGDQAAALLGDYLGRPCRLVRMAPGFTRQLSQRHLVTGREEVGFADSMPLLLTAQASLEDLNSRLPDPVEMSRFRPNIVVAGSTPFQEDTWKRLRIGEGIFRVAKSCIRCEIITVDQESGEKGVQPLETLGTYRTGPKGIAFGRHLVHERLVTIRTGDEVEVLE